MPTFERKDFAITKLKIESSDRLTFCRSLCYSLTHTFHKKNCKMFLSNVVNITQEYKYLRLNKKDYAITKLKNRYSSDLAS